MAIDGSCQLATIGFPLCLKLYDLCPKTAGPPCRGIAQRIADDVDLVFSSRNCVV